MLSAAMMMAHKELPVDGVLAGLTSNPARLISYDTENGVSIQRHTLSSYRGYHNSTAVDSEGVGYFGVRMGNTSASTVIHKLEPSGLSTVTTNGVLRSTRFVVEPDGSYIYSSSSRPPGQSGNRDPQIRKVSISSGESTRLFWISGSTSGIARSICLDPSGQYVYFSTGNPSMLYKINKITGDVQNSIGIAATQIVADNDNSLYIISINNSIVRLSKETFSTLRTYTSPESIGSMSLTPDGGLVVVGNTIITKLSSNLTVERSITNSVGYNQGVVVGPSGNVYVAKDGVGASADGRIHKFDSELNSVFANIESHIGYGPMMSLALYQSWLWS